jgi:nitrogen fixation protein NifU and related proteins
MEELYRKAILDHYQRPKHRRALPDADLTASAADPLCGDEMLIRVKIDSDRIRDAAFEARGCSISQASADLMIESVLGATTAETEARIEAFEAMLQGASAPIEEQGLGDLTVLGGVRRYPSRIKCALLPWRTLRSALDSQVDAGRPAEGEGSAT